MRRVRLARRPESEERRLVSLTLRRAVSELCCDQNPDSSLSNRGGFSAGHQWLIPGHLGEKILLPHQKSHILII